jgi:hypothetical protein
LPELVEGHGGAGAAGLPVLSTCATVHRALPLAEGGDQVGDAGGQREVPALDALEHEGGEGNGLPSDMVTQGCAGRRAAMARSA